MVYKVKSAFKKDELREILKDITSRLENNFLFSMSYDNKLFLKDGLIKQRISSSFSDNDFPLSFMARIKQIGDKKWVVKDSSKRYIITEENDRLYVYSNKPLKLDIRDIKGIIMTEIIKRDPCLVFLYREKLLVTIDNIPEWDKAMGEGKACHKKEKRVKKYKKRLDKWWKKAKKELKK